MASMNDVEKAVYLKLWSLEWQLDHCQIGVKEYWSGLMACRDVLAVLLGHVEI